jgi:flagellin
VTFLANSDGSGFTVNGQDLTLVGLRLSAGSTFTSATTAKAMISQIDTAIGTATNKLASLGTARPAWTPT